MGGHNAAPEGTPETAGIAPGTRITVEYVTMRDDGLAMFNAAERVMRLNVAAGWEELLAAYCKEVFEAFGLDPGWLCPVIPLPLHRGA